MFKKKITYIILTLSILLNIVLGYYVKEHDEITKLKLKVKKSLDLGEEKNEWVIETANYLSNQEDSSQNTLIDSVRNYIQNNSIHKERTKYHKTRAFLQDSVIKDMYQYHQGKNGQLPELSCSPRAWVMRRLLLNMGIHSRIVLFNYLDGSKMKSHTIIDVYNEDSKTWELQDPDVGVYFKDTVNNKRVSFYAMKDMDTLSYVPCRGDSCDWKLVYYDLKNKDLFAMVRYYYFKEDYKDQIVLIDSRKIENKLDSFDLYKYFEGQKNVLVY